MKAAKASPHAKFYNLSTEYNEYLNYKIWHGGRLRSLDQTLSECEWNLVEIICLKFKFCPRMRLKSIFFRIACF